MNRKLIVLATTMFGSACTSDGDGDGQDTDPATSGPQTAADSNSDADAVGDDADSLDGDTDGGDDTDTDSDSGPGPGTTGEPPSEPGVHHTQVMPLPGGEPTACEWDWTIRTLHYSPSAIVPRRMYNASCNEGPDARMFTSLAVGANADHPQPDPTSGAIVVSELDNASGTLHPTQQRHLSECVSTHGIAVSDDCQTIGVLCRIPSGTTGFDVDVLATHPNADWMTQPNMCGDKMNDEMWLYEWTDGDIEAEPNRYIVHKAIGSWEYGNNYLRLGDDGDSWGIAVKATVGGQDLESGCHEADAFLVMDRQTSTMTTRGWSWACGTGHTTFNRLAFDPESARYAMLCSTDYNTDQVGGLGAFYFRLEDGPAEEFHLASIDGLRMKGGASAIVPREGGGYLGLIVSVDDAEPEPGTIAFEPGTGIGLTRWTADGQMDGAINWIVEDPDGYLGYSTLAVLSPGRYLLGWGVMQRFDDAETVGDDGYRIPREFRMMEIDDDGNALSDVTVVDGAGWGELDEMVPLGQGRAGWAYIADPALVVGGDERPQFPSCNQPGLQLSVYTPQRG